MRRIGHVHSSWFFSLVCGLLMLLTACSSQPGNPPASTPTPTQEAAASSSPTAQPTASPQPMPPTSVDCPVSGNGRAAVIKALTLGPDQNLLYTYKDSASTWHLRRYDARTGQKTDLTTTADGQLEDAQISADGQWVLFLLDVDAAKRTDASAKIQMIRMDGQGLQTLYCFPVNETYSHTTPGGSGAGSPLPIGLQLAADQKSLLFSLDTQDKTSTIFDLTMATGQVKQVFQDAANTQFMTTVVTWLDNSSAYLLTQGRTAPAPPATIRLLDVAQALTNPANATSQIFQGGGRMNELSLDSSFDNATLYINDCLLAGNPFQTTTIARPSHAGGTAQTIYHSPASICVDEIRVISATTILMLVTNQNGTTNAIQHEVWTMNVNGTAQRSLTTLTPNDSQFQFNPNSQYVWSNISRDNSLYALQQETNNNVENLVYGSVRGGDVTTLASSSTHTLTLVGWTTM